VDVAHNSSGSNLVQGVTSLAVAFADLRGGLAYGALVAEVDEGALHVVADELRPQALVIVDLFRDQLDRYGELHALGDALDPVARGSPDRALVERGRPASSSRSRRTGGLPRHAPGSSRVSLDRITRAPTRSAARVRHASLPDGPPRIWATGRAGWVARPPLTSQYRSGGHGPRDPLHDPPPGRATIDLATPQAGVHVAYDAPPPSRRHRPRCRDTRRGPGGIRPAWADRDHRSPDGRSSSSFSKNPTS
jgi:hypothetical protein